jgi:SRSO17 transposase
MAYAADIERRLAPDWGRAEPRRRAMASLRGLLSPAARKNSWPLAKVSGEATPYGVQPLLGRADGDPDAVRDARRTSVIQSLGDPHGVLVRDDTGFLKQGRHSAGVARPYSGTAGRMENGHMGGLGDAGDLGHTWLARALDLPGEWPDEGERCRQGGIPENRRFATQPQLAHARRQRALAAGVPATWVTGDRGYGNERRGRLGLEAQPQGDVLAVSGKECVWWHGQLRPVNTILAALPEDGWTRLSAGDGTKGPRWDDWRWLPLADPMDPNWRRWWVVRRRMTDPAEMQASVVCAPQATTLAGVVRVAGTRGGIEPLFEAAQGEVGLDHDEGRRWTGWSRPRTLALGALALLTVLRAGAIAVEACKKRLPPPPEARRLAAFKAQRGLRAHEACPRCGGSCGGWPGRSSRPPSISWRGRSGVGGTSASPSTITTNVVGHYRRDSRHDYLIATVVLGPCNKEVRSS